MTNAVWSSRVLTFSIQRSRATVSSVAGCLVMSATGGRRRAAAGVMLWTLEYHPALPHHPLHISVELVAKK